MSWREEEEGGVVDDGWEMKGSLTHRSDIQVCGEEHNVLDAKPSQHPSN